MWMISGPKVMPITIAAEGLSPHHIPPQPQGHKPKESIPQHHEERYVFFPPVSS